MIKIRRLSHSVNSHKILNNINCDLPDSGIVAIVGPSGSGKTTFLNCLSTLVDYDGTIEHDGINVVKQNMHERDLFRLKRFGYIFQQYNLYENLSVEDNVLMPYQAISNNSNNNNFELKINEVLSLIGIQDLKKKIVNKLSGGEKQRVAIARAIINNPKVIFADEPTGALDKENSIKIMQLLSQIASKSLVIIVSHDLELIQSFASQILEIKDGEIVSISYFNQEKQPALISKVKPLYNSPNSKLHLSFLLRYTLAQIKVHKLKTLLSGLVCSLGMLALGLSLSLSNIISSSVISAYSGLIESDRVIIQRKENDLKINKCALSENEVISIAKKYSNYIEDIGICYQANFEEIFEDKNTLGFQVEGKNKVIPGFGAREINDFVWLDYENVQVFPNMPSEMNNDEIVLGLTFGQIKYICSELKIKQSVESLGEYISSYGLDVVYDFAHYDWEYEDQQILSVKGVCLVNTSTLYHDNHMWNKNMYEDKMRFPTKDDFDKMDVPPWTLNKAFYYKINIRIDTFLDFARYEKAFDYVALEIPNKQFFSNVKETSKEDRLILFSGFSSDLLPRYYSYFQEIINGIKNPIFGSPGGYGIFPDYMMSGFGNLMFFSSDEEKIIEISDLYDFLDEDERNDIVMPGVLNGHFTKTNFNGVGFKPLSKEINLISGRLPTSYDEIVISSSMSEKLNFNGDSLYYSCKKINNSKKSDFHIGSLNIVGVIDSNTNDIYHFQDWVLTFFQAIVGISVFDMPLTAISFQMAENFDFSSSEQILEKSFPKLTIIDPLSDVVLSANEVGSKIQIFLLILSILILVISLFIIIQSLGLYFDRIKKDVGIARIIGISKSSSSGFIYSYLGLIIFSSFLFSCVELFIVSIFTSLSIGSVTGSTTFVLFNPISFFAMFLFGLFIGLITFFILKNKIGKLSPFECIKRN